MPRAKRKATTREMNNTAANLGFEQQLWAAANALRGSMDAAEYKHVVLGLIFLKYISDAFEEQRARLEAEREQGADPEDPDEYRADNVFWVPPVRNANFAWVRHIIHHLAPTGYAGFVLANGSMSSNQSGEGEIRKNIIEADLVDCMIALPGQLFYSTQIPACLWFLARDKSGRPPAGQRKPLRDRRGQVLFIDARRMGRMVDRVHRELTEEEIQRIACTYHAWRGEPDAGKYEDIPASRRARRLRRSASTATSSPLVATWGRRCRTGTTSRSRRRSSGSWPSSTSSRPRRDGLRRRSGRT